MDQEDTGILGATLTQPNDAQLVRYGVRARFLSPEEAEDVLFLFRKFRGRRSLEEIIFARGYLTAPQLESLRRAFQSGRRGSTPPRFGSASVDPGAFSEGFESAEAVPLERNPEKTVVTPMDLPSGSTRDLTFVDAHPAPEALEPAVSPRDEPSLLWTASLSPLSEPADEGFAEPTRVDALADIFGRRSDGPKTPPNDAAHGGDAPNQDFSAFEQTASSGDFEPQPASVTALGGYRIDGLVAKGPRATVYRATDLSKDRTVALRVFRGNPSRVSRLVEEAGPRLVVAARLAHPSLVRVLDLGRADDRHFIVLEYVSGLTLEERLAAEGPLPVLTALEVGRDVARGLGAIHGIGEVHGDLRPDRILLAADGRARVAGLGLPAVPAIDVSEGLPCLPAPELAWGTSPAAASDLYALGGILHVALTGRLPFDPTDARALTEALDRTREGLSDARPDVPSDVARLVTELLDPSPERRPRTAAEVADALARAAIREEGVEGGVRTAGIRPSWTKVALRTAAGVMLLVAAVVFATAMYDTYLPWAGAGSILTSCAVVLAGALELVRQGQIPWTFGTAWLVRARDLAALFGAASLAASGFTPKAAGFDGILSVIGGMLGVFWCFGVGLRSGIADARPDAGKGRTLAVLGDLRLRRWRQVALPFAAAAGALAGLRWVLLVYFSTPGAHFATP